MSAVSVGFRPTEEPKKILDEENNWTGGYEFNGQELLELSAVPIPANPNAIMRAFEEAEGRGELSFERELRCALFGEKNPPWAMSVPGVTLPVETDETAKGKIMPKKDEPTQSSTADLISKLISKEKEADPAPVSTNNIALDISELADAIAERLEPDSSAQARKIVDALSVNASRDDVEALAAKFKAIETGITYLLQSQAKAVDLANLATRSEENRLAFAAFSSSAAKRSDVAELVARFESLRSSFSTFCEVCARRSDVAAVKGSVDSAISEITRLSTKAATSEGLAILAGSIDAIRERVDRSSESEARQETVETLARELGALRARVEELADSVATRGHIEDLVYRIENGCRRLDELTTTLSKATGQPVERVSLIRVEKTVCPYVDDPIAPKGTTWDASAEMAKQTTPSGW